MELIPKHIPIGYPSSITLFLIFVIILLTFIKYNFGKNIKESFLAFFNYRQSIRVFEERRDSDRQSSILSNIFFALVIGIFVSMLFPFYGTNPLWGNYTLSILFFSVAVVLIYFVKACIWQILGGVFIVQNFSKVYIYNMFLFNRIVGYIIFPLVAIFPYIYEIITPFIVYSVFAIIVLSYFFKLWRIFKIFNEQNVGFFYFILYLCTFEILPLLLFIKSCKILSESVIV